MFQQMNSNHVTHCYRFTKLQSCDYDNISIPIERILMTVLKCLIPQPQIGFHRIENT